MSNLQVVPPDASRYIGTIRESFMAKVITDQVSFTHTTYNTWVPDCEALVKTCEGLLTKYTVVKNMHDGEINEILFFTQDTYITLEFNKHQSKDKKVSIAAGATGKANFGKLLKMVQDVAPIMKVGNVARGLYALVYNHGDIETRLVDKVDSTFIEDNYEDHVIEQFNNCVSIINNNNPNNLMIIDGPPGTGKSHLLKGFIERCESTRFIVVPPDMIAHLAKPDMMTYLLDENISPGGFCFILEDADECLLPRDSGNLSAISALLNLTDGLLGRALNIKIICTTNAKVDKIDSALTRKGRLAARIHVGNLPPEQAAIVLGRLRKNTQDYGFTNSVPLGDIYAMATEEQPSLTVVQKRAVGF
jgi:hypothetical protein